MSRTIHKTKTAPKTIRLSVRAITRKLGKVKSYREFGVKTYRLNACEFNSLLNKAEAIHV